MFDRPVYVLFCVLCGWQSRTGRQHHRNRTAAQELNSSEAQSDHSCHLAGNRCKAPQPHDTTCDQTTADHASRKHNDRRIGTLTYTSILTLTHRCAVLPASSALSL